MRELLAQRLRDSITEHKLAVEAFARSVQAKHHGEVKGITEFATEMGIGLHDVIVGFNQGSVWFEAASTPSASAYLENSIGWTIAGDIDAVAARTTAQLRELAP